MQSVGMILDRFLRDEDGLVTVEWVALTASVVIAAITIGFIIMQNTHTEASSIGAGINSKVTAVYGANGSNL